MALGGPSFHTPPASVLMEGGLPRLSRPLCVLGCPGSMSAAPPRPGTRLPDLPQPRRDMWGLTGPPPRAERTGRCGQGWLLVPGRPLLLGPLAPACQPAPGLPLVPRGPRPPLPQGSLFPGHTGRHCSGGRPGQQSAFCGWHLGMPLAAWGGWGGMQGPGLRWVCVCAGPAGEGRMDPSEAGESWSPWGQCPAQALVRRGNRGTRGL